MNYISRAGIEFKTVGTGKTILFNGRSNQEITRIVFACVQEICNVEYEEIISNRRFKPLRESRQLVHYFLKKYTNMTVQAIGDSTRNDHTTVLHSVRVVESDLSDRIYRLNFENIDYGIKNKLNN
jgi:chromosomal replication initiation ATPase DnaA